MSIDLNKHEVDIDNLKKQNVNDLASIKDIYKKLDEIEKKLTQIKYVDSTLTKKLKNEYENLKKVILNENIQLQLYSKIDEAKTELTNNMNGAKNEFRTQMDTKANKSDLDIQKNRIDSLIALPDGSTTADGELLDIRIGENGVSYNSSGESVRRQFNIIKDYINEIYSSFTDNVTNLNLVFYNNSVNNIGEVGNANLKRAAIKELISVPANKILKITLNSGYIYSLYTFNSGGEFEKVDYNINLSTNYLVGNKCYRLLVTKQDDTQEIKTDEANLAIIVQSFFLNPVNEIKIIFNNGRYINYTDGKSYPNDNYYYNDYFIEIKNGGLLILKDLNLSNTNANLAGISFYDKYYNYISGEQLEKSNYFSCNIPESALYMKVSSQSNNAKLYIIDKSKKTEDYGENPTKYNGKEISVFNNILCIGDSLTAGVFDYSEDGGGLGIRSQYSYPSQLSKITGCNVINWGISGATTQSWYENKISISKWQWYDCAIINLGANDNEKNGVTPSSSKHYLQKIINKLKEDNSNIKIFLMTVVPAYYNKDSKWYSAINETRYELSKTNENCYFVDLSKYSETGDDIYHYGHLTAIGYRKEAEEIVAYISKIIAENIKEFKWVQHIGTTHLGE